MSWLSALLGLDASSNAGKAQKKATQYTDQAQVGYKGLSDFGSLIPTAQNQNLLSLLSNYASSSGLNLGIPNPSQAVNNQPTPQQISPSPPAMSPANSGTFNAANQAYRQQQSQNLSAQNNSPYSLLPHQTQMLNQHIDRINQQQQVDLASLKQEFANRGITDPRALAAMEQQVNEHYAALQNQTETDFYEQARKEKEQATANILNTLLNAYQSGTAGIAGLGGAQQQQANFNTQLANNQMGGLLNLIGFGVGGGFNKTSSVPPIIVPSPLGTGTIYNEGAPNVSGQV